MVLTFQFEKSLSPILGTIHRPVARVLFYSQPKRKWYEIWMLVDSGADYTLLPRYFSNSLGVNLKKDCWVFKTAGIGGEEKVYFLKKIQVRLGEWTRHIPVGFLDRDDIPPLLGRHLFLETFEVHFSPKHFITFEDKQ
ncbi:MAG: retropepsin-like aspartic protease [Patescibacteria group bacterium]